MKMIEGTATANGIRIWYEIIGERSEPVVMLIAGGGAIGRTRSDDFCEKLVAGGRCVVRFDNRDVGRSQLFEKADVSYTLLDMANDTVGLLDALDFERVHLAGTSMGGMISQTVAIEHPGRVITLTSIMSTTGKDYDPLAAMSAPIREFVTVGRIGKSREEQIEEEIHFWRMLSGPRLPFDEDWWRKEISKWFDHGWDPKAVQGHVTAIQNSPPREEALRKLTIPTLVIHGTEDPVVPFHFGEATARVIPNAKLVAIDGMGHTISPPIFDQVVSAILAHTGEGN
jgi:pimeloyl-ACP methyl ester carboxylesterase